MNKYEPYENMSDFELYSYFTRTSLATLASLDEFNQMHSIHDNSHKYRCNEAQYHHVLSSQTVGATQEVLYTPDFQKPLTDKSNFTHDSVSRHTTSKMKCNRCVPVPLYGTLKLKTNDEPKLIKQQFQGRTAKALPELKVLDQCKPSRYTPYQTKTPCQMKTYTTVNDSNTRNGFTPPSNSLEIISQHGHLPKKSENFSMSTPLRRPFTIKPENLPCSQSPFQNMTSDAEAATLLLILSQGNMQPRQITPKHETKSALNNNISCNEIPNPDQIKPELKTMGKTRSDLAQDQKLPVIDHQDWLKMMKNSQPLLQPQTTEEKVELIISEACRKINIGANSQTLPCMSDEFEKFMSRLETKGFKINNGEEYSNVVTNFVIPNSHETATIPDEEQTETSESDGCVTNEVFEEHNYNNYEHKHNKTRSNYEKVPIGLGYASVPINILKNMNWSSYTNCTRKLMTAVFPRRVLATHSLTGRASPAFPEKPAKKKLNPKAINDIVQTVMDNCGVSESQIRVCITTKCADEAKMLRMREEKDLDMQARKSAEYKENCPPSSDSEDDNDHEI